MDDCTDDVVLAAVDSFLNDHVNSQDLTVDSLQLRPPTAAVKRLLTKVSDLEQTLEATERVWREGEMARAWAAVAESQRAQCERVIEDNMMLNETVSEQLCGAHRMLLLVLTSHQLMRPSYVWMCQYEPQFRPTPNHASYTVLLRERMTTTDFQSWAGPRPPIGPPFWKRTSERGRHSLRVCNRYGMFLPFKLSTVARVMWECVNTRDRFDFTSAEQDEVRRTIVGSVEEPFGRYEIHGPGLFLREYQPDGSVVFKWGTIASPHRDSDGDVMAGFVVHETGWMRATRVQTSGSRHIIYLGQVSWKVVEPAGHRSVKVHRVTPSRNLPIV